MRVGSVDSYITKDGARLWRVRHELPPDPATGRRRQTTRRGFATKKQAEHALRQALGRVESGTHVEHHGQTVAEYLTTWLAGIAVKPSTRAGYEQSILLHLVPVRTPGGRPRPGIGGHRLQALTADHLDVLYRWLEREGGSDAGPRRNDGTRARIQPRPLAPKTVRHVHTAIRKALQDAVERGYVIRNVADLANPPTQRQARSRRAQDVWTAEQLRAFLTAARGHRLYAGFHLLATTGVRRAELCGLRWDAVDLEAGVLRVRWTLVMVGGVLVEQDATKTDAGERTIALDPDTVAELREHRRRQLEERILVGPAWTDPVGRVFTTPVGEQVRPDALLRAVQNVAREAGLPKPTVHGLRHAYATAALRAGVKPEVLSKRLGHASVAITMDIYRHVQEGEDAEAAAIAARAILG